MYKYLVFFLVVFSVYSQAEEVVNRDSTTKNNFGLVEVSDAELKLVSGQTGNTEQLQRNIDKKAESSVDFQAQTKQHDFVEPPKVISYFNGSKL